MSTLPPRSAPYIPAYPVRHAIVITDIGMTIGAMSRFMVKWVIATIPALIILWLILLAVGFAVAILFHSLIGPMRHSF